MRRSLPHAIKPHPNKERDMIGMNLRCPITGITGTVDAQVVEPDGKALVRIADHWLEAEGLVPA
jgi:hypothetical protein